jgi:hypothetical protein
MDFAEIRDKVKRLNFPMGQYALFGSTPMAAHGIREAHDIDIVVSHELYGELEKQGWNKKVLPSGTKILVKDDIEAFDGWNYLDSYRPDTATLIREANIIDGIPVVKLKEVLVWKKAFGREKDLRDAELIEKFMKTAHT